MTTDEITSMAQQADAMLTIRALPDNAESNGGVSPPARTPGYRADFDGDT